jgi:hypothetical protein
MAAAASDLAGLAGWQLVVRGAKGAWGKLFAWRQSQAAALPSFWSMSSFAAGGFRPFAHACHRELNRSLVRMRTNGHLRQ